MYVGHTRDRSLQNRRGRSRTEGMPSHGGRTSQHYFANWASLSMSKPAPTQVPPGQVNSSKAIVGSPGGLLLPKRSAATACNDEVRPQPFRDYPITRAGQASVKCTVSVFFFPLFFFFHLLLLRFSEQLVPSSLCLDGFISSTAARTLQNTTGPTVWVRTY